MISQLLIGQKLISRGINLIIQLRKQWIGDDSVNDGQAIPFLHRAYYTLGKWFLILIIAFFFSIIAFCIDKVEILLVGFKHGYCRSNWFASQISCCIDNPKN